MHFTSISMYSLTINQSQINLSLLFLRNIFTMADQQKKDEPQKASKCPLIIRITNVITALLLIGFGTAGFVVMLLSSILSTKFFLAFSPIFMVLFGFMILGAEFKFKIIFKYFTFLRSMIGRGIFNFYLASNVFYFFSCSSSNDVVGWIAAILLFVIGIFYIYLQFCGPKLKEEEVIKKEGKEEELVTP